MKRFTLPLVALGLSSLVGCSDASVERLATEREAIVNGTLSSPEDDAVISVSASGTVCTGTLIAPNVVLTALHCVAVYDAGFRFNCQSDGTLPPGATIGQLGPTVDPAGVTVSFGVTLGSEKVRAKAIYGTGSSDACHDDLALVVLESAPAIGDVPLVSLRFTPRTRKGELTRVVGYGDVEQTATDRGRQVRRDIVVRGIGQLDASSQGDLGVLPRTLQIGEGPCHGDSGGPLFSEETGAQIGVYSLLGANTCTGADVRNTYTLVAPFEPLIRTALEAASAQPIVEPVESIGSGGEGGEAGSVAVDNGSGGSASTGGTTGDGAAPADPAQGTGRGSFRDSSCAFSSTSRASSFDQAPLFALMLFGIACARRRRP